MQAFYCDDTPMALPEGHRFPMEKYRMLRERVARLLPQVDLHGSDPVSVEQLCLAHDAAYVRAVEDGKLEPAVQREIGFVWSPQLVLRSRRSVGATLQAARAALTDGIAVNLAGGTHHASAARGAGFCVFNDVAVAARVVQQEQQGWHARAGGEGSRRMQIAVVDLDVHQGDGTAAIFADDPSVFTLSMHGERNFPFTKIRGDLDVDLPDGCGDPRYLDELDIALAQMWTLTAARAPQLLFYLAGCDPHEGDRLGRLRLTADGLRRRDAMVLSAARERGIPVVVMMAGGYGRDLDRMVGLQAQTVHQCWLSWWHTQRERQREQRVELQGPDNPAP
ncbi:MAG: histone deacetylase [Aquabacterium sp.]|nr:MAG: histone deacetylase [Aquabacterium sp.]